MHIAVTQTNGYMRQTNQNVGSAAEQAYYRVITEKSGKLYFDSKDDYLQWASSKHRLDTKQARGRQSKGGNGGAGMRRPRNLALRGQTAFRPAVGSSNVPSAPSGTEATNESPRTGTY